MIRDVTLNDATHIADIYNHYVDNSIATFEETALSDEDMHNRITEVQSLGLPWIVYEENDKILGYAYGSKWKGRCAYRFSVEITVYLTPHATSKGIGSTLYQALFSRLRKTNTHIAIAGISLPNPASIALHEKMGMEKVAHFKEVGFKFDQWIDVGYWQINLNTTPPSQG